MADDSVDAPGSAAAPYTSGTGTALDASDSSSRQDGAVLRSALREILQIPPQCEQRADAAPITPLVFDRISSKACVRIRAFEADGPMPGKTSTEEYQGYTVHMGSAQLIGIGV
ncbi:hypothetical protein DSL72_004168 [Monilinia vaccinii-corymbosi]|uniref:Uncharacterized protein n=1 Tax=Monilinia vaccinii-corymbosi TaxID=61207 RepID=A0A8A3NYK9_9HELO|nr:hypothetical protein DSL72_004168 [Monilinia vaccinii-corymbosi]